MTTEASITTLFVVCVISIALCAFFYFRCVDLECKVYLLQASKDDLRESLTKHNYSLFQEKEELEKELAAKTEEIDELKRCTRKLAKTNRL